jgi:hypothetical protein
VSSFVNVIIDVVDENDNVLCPLSEVSFILFDIVLLDDNVIEPIKLIVSESLKLANASINWISFATL